jgi:SPP1 family phage portal protein
MNTAIDKAGFQRFTWGKSDPIDKESLQTIIKDYLQSDELKRLQIYNDYYQGNNTEIVRRYRDKKQRNKTPNNKIETAYFSTIIDSMGGYLFNNIQYVAKESKDKSKQDDKQTDEYTQALNQILYDNNVEIKDMNSGTMALVYNKAIELVYTVGDATTTEIKFANIDPRQMILVYDEGIEHEVIAGVYIIQSHDKNFDYYVDVIYNNVWQYWKVKDYILSEREPDRTLYFKQCPVVVYNTEIVNQNSSFATIIPYIDALDYVISGNSNEMERLVDTILKLSRLVKPEDAANMAEWKFIDGLKSDDIAEYIQKDTSPEFRKYVSQLLIQEIHKHSHIIDWYSPDSGMTGEVSAKALLTRLYDMQLFSQRIEKVYRKGAWKRIELINDLMAIKSMPIGEVEIKFNRTLPDMMIEKMQGLKDVPFLSDQTKRELVGIDEEQEKKRLEEQSQEININDLMPQKPEDNTSAEDDKSEEEIV